MEYAAYSSVAKSREIRSLEFVMSFGRGPLGLCWMDGSRALRFKVIHADRDSRRSNHDKISIGSILVSPIAPVLDDRLVRFQSIS